MSRKRIVVLMAAALTGSLTVGASVAYAVQGDPIPGVDISIEQSPSGLAYSELPSTLTFKTHLTATMSRVKIAVSSNGATPLTFPEPPGVGPLKGEITSISGTLTGNMSCRLGTDAIEDGDPTPAAPSGVLTLTIRYPVVTGLAKRSSRASNNYNSAKSNTAGILESGGDATKPNDVAFVGLITSGYGQGQTVIIDQVLTTKGPNDWWNCAHGGPAITTMTTANRQPPVKGSHRHNADIGVDDRYQGFLGIGEPCAIGYVNPATGVRTFVGSDSATPCTSGAKL